jgi:hypothetical protein
MNRPSEKGAQRKKDSNRINFAKLCKNAREDGECLVVYNFFVFFVHFQVLHVISCRFEGLG